MRNIGTMICCWLLLSSLCVSSGASQDSVRYPQNADDITAFVKLFSQVDFSIKDAIRRLGDVNPANHDDEVHLHDLGILLTPPPPQRDKVKRVVLNTFDDAGEVGRKLDSVRIDYIKPASILFGDLKKHYGVPTLLSPPLVKCRPGVDCRPRFVGYRFVFTPDTRSLAAGKKLEVSIAIEMEWSKVVPRHSDRDLLDVKAIRFKRIWKD